MLQELKKLKAARDAALIVHWNFNLFSNRYQSGILYLEFLANAANDTDCKKKYVRYGVPLVNC